VNLNWADFPYEIHLTLPIEDDEPDDLQRVVSKFDNTKLILLDLYRQGKTTQQVTTSTYVPAGIDHREVMKRLVQHMHNHAFLVNRIKMETVPWHPYAESADGSLFRRKKVYFETHYKWLIPTTELEKFRNSFLPGNSIRLSRNTLKHEVAGETSIMGTVRTFDRTFKAHTDMLEYEEMFFAKPYVKKISEFAFFDTNRSLDTQWLRA